jgi:D-aminopeptidase
MIVVATDAPMVDRQLKRLARRAVLGLGRTGSMGGHGSGDVVIAFSTAPEVRVPYAAPSARLHLETIAEFTQANGAETIDALFAAVVEATEESILNALFQATTVVGRDDHRREALPVEEVTEMLRAAGRLAPPTDPIGAGSADERS